MERVRGDGGEMSDPAFRLWGTLIAERPPRTDPYGRNERIRLVRRILGVEANTRIRMNQGWLGMPGAIRSALNWPR